MQDGTNETDIIKKSSIMAARKNYQDKINELK